MNRHAYRAVVHPDGPYWSIDVPAVGRTPQASTLADVPTVAQELVCLVLDVTPDEVEIIVDKPTPVAAQA